MIGDYGCRWSEFGIGRMFVIVDPNQHEKENKVAWDKFSRFIAEDENVQFNRYSISGNKKLVLSPFINFEIFLRLNIGNQELFKCFF